MNGNSRGKISVTLLFVYISWKTECSHLFKVSFEELIVMRSKKTNVKYIKEYYVWKNFFGKLAGWHILLRINFFKLIFKGFLLNEHLPMVASRSYTKCLKSTCEINKIMRTWNIFGK